MCTKFVHMYNCYITLCTRATNKKASIKCVLITFKYMLTRYWNSYVPNGKTNDLKIEQGIQQGKLLREQHFYNNCPLINSPTARISCISCLVWNYLRKYELRKLPKLSIKENIISNLQSQRGLFSLWKRMGQFSFRISRPISS